MNKTWPLSSRAGNPATRSAHTLSHTAKVYPGFYMPPEWGIIIISIAIIINVFLSRAKNRPVFQTLILLIVIPAL